MTAAAVITNAGGSPVRDPFLSRVARALEKRDLERARAIAEALLSKQPGSSEARFALALAALLADDLAGAAALAVDAFEADPNVRETADLAAVTYGLAGDLTTAVYYGKLAAVMPASPRLAALLPPSLPPFARVLCEISERPLLERGSRALAAGAWPTAEHWLRQHLAFEPDCREAQVRLALCLLSQGRARGAADALRAARHQRPADAEIASLLGRALTASGRFVEAAACHGCATSQAPDDPAVHAAALVDALADPACRPGDAAAGFRAWGRRFGERRTPGLMRSTSVAARSLVIGLFVAGNADSPEATALTRILMHRNAGRFTMVGFGYGSLSYDPNIRFQTAVDRWHDIGGSDPLTLAAMVEAEEIDILVDLAGFSAPHLLIAFGGRMAPCQVAWLNAPYGTGLDAVDYLLTDRFVDAEAADCRGDREARVHLDLGCVPIVPVPPDGRERERSEPGIDFAADATLADLEVATVALWAEILHRVPGSRLMLRDRAFRHPETLADLIDRFGNFAVADRVDIVAADSAEALFVEADVALLPLAYPQPATVAAALAAGIPLVCLAGEGRHRRLAASLIHHLGLGVGAIADGAEDYARLAARWAEDAGARTAFRGSLGERLGSSEAADPRARARPASRARTDVAGDLRIRPMTGTEGMMTKKAGMRSHREKRNRQAFAQRFPAVLQAIEGVGQRSTFLVEDDGVPVNIELGGALLYPGAAPAYTCAQLQAFRADPDRLGFTDPSHCNLLPISLKLLDDLVRYMRDHGLTTRLTQYPVADVGYLFVFGVGLGRHLEALLTETPARHVVLIEPFAEFLSHSLAAADWRKLFAIAERRRISFHFILAQEPEAICREIEQLISASGNVFLDGSYFFQHYHCWIFRESISILKECLKVYFNTSGFFEDEVEMIRNCHGNLRRRDLRVVAPKRCREQSFPVIIAGAGPSLDRDLPRLRELRDRAIVVSCGTAIGVLLRNGIRPDLHCEIERGELVHTLLSRVRDTYGFEGITLVASTTVDPRVPSLFEKTWCFVRAGLSPAVILTDGIPALPFVDPLCCNAAFATVAALGFRNIWLFGLDLAQKEEGRHHAKDSVYYDPENAAIDEDYRRRFNRVVAGNFGGTVRTFWAFDAGRHMLGRAQRHFRTNLVNCSDGASIDGATAKVAAAVALPAAASPRNAVLASLESSLRAVALGELLTPLDLQPHIRGCEEYLRVLDEVLQAWLQTDDGFFDLEERLVSAVRDELDSFRGFHSMSRGSVIAMLRLGAFFGSRITDPAESAAYREHFAVCYRTHCATIAAEARDLLASLDDDDGAAAESRPRAA